MNNDIVKIRPYTSEVLKNDLTLLNYIYPNLIIGSIGQSTLQEDIPYLKLGDGNNHILISAAQDAREWHMSLILMKFIENFLMFFHKKAIYKGYDMQDIWKKTSLYFIPMVNPDGVNLNLRDKKMLNNETYKYLWENSINQLENWKSNIRGINLNLNYPKNWKSLLKNFAGPNPLSEIETINMVHFIKLFHFDFTISLQERKRTLTKLSDVDKIYDEIEELLLMLSDV